MPVEKKHRRVVMVGLNHQTAPLHLREQLAFRDTAVTDAARDLQDRCSMDECVILSTCNRSEFYGVGGHCTSADLLEALARLRDVDPALLQSHTYTAEEQAAAQHLCRVAAGLESMVLGEGQILGQVKTAAETAAAGKTTGPILSALFRQAITAGKRARSETAIARGAVSVSHAAVELARQIFGSLEGCRALVLGAGEMGEVTLNLLRNAGLKTSIMISSRTRERAEALARRCEGIGVEWNDFPAALAQADIVIVSTSAPHYIVRCDTVRQAMKRRRGRHIFLIDISVPRNVDPEVGDLNDVFLYNIDDLQEVVARNREGRSAEVEQVEQIIAEEISRFEAWRKGLDVAPAIVTLREHAEGIRQQEWERFGQRLDHLSERDRRTVEALTRQLVNSLLEQPMSRLKSLGVNGKGYDRVEVVRELFGDPENAAPASRTAPDEGHTAAGGERPALPLCPSGTTDAAVGEAGR